MNHARAPARAVVQTAARTAVLLQGQDHARVPVQTALSGRQDLRDLAAQLAQLVLRGLKGFAAPWAQPDLRGLAVLLVQLVLKGPAVLLAQPDLRGPAALWAQLVLRAPAAQQEQPDLRDLAV